MIVLVPYTWRDGGPLSDDYAVLVEADSVEDALREVLAAVEEGAEELWGYAATDDAYDSPEMGDGGLFWYCEHRNGDDVVELRVRDAEATAYATREEARAAAGWRVPELEVSPSEDHT